MASLYDRYSNAGMWINSTGSERLTDPVVSEGLVLQFVRDISFAYDNVASFAKLVYQ